MNYRVKQAAAAAGVSVRTLHHWDRLGLLVPRKDCGNGYRIYSDSDMNKLQQILFFRELEFSLESIKAILESPGFDRRQVLHDQRALLLRKRNRLDAIIASLDKTIESEKDGKAMDDKEKFSAFDISEIEEHRKKYADEAREKYGPSAAWKQSSMKTSAYNEDDWKRITEEGNAIMAELSGLMDLDPSSAAVQNVVEKWRSHITGSYYDCSREILAGLGQMYTADQRFKQNIDKTADGLAEFLSAAIAAY